MKIMKIKKTDAEEDICKQTPKREKQLIFSVALFEQVEKRHDL